MWGADSTFFSLSPVIFFFYNRTKIGGSFMIWFFLWLINFHQRQLRIVWDSEKWQNFHSTKKKEVMIPPFSVFHSVTSRFASVDDGFLAVSISTVTFPNRHFLYNILSMPVKPMWTKFVSLSIIVPASFSKLFFRYGLMNWFEKEMCNFIMKNYRSS